MSVTRPRLILVRHGRSAHVHRGWIDSAGLARWQVAYDAAGLHDDDAPPASVAALAREAALVVSSDMPRAIASASRLVGPDRAPTSPLLREIPLRLPTWPRVRLPLAGWALAIGLGTAWRTLRGQPAHEAIVTQARSAAAWLASLAEERGTVLAVTHGALRGHLAAALRERGWSAPSSRSIRHWSAWELTAVPASRRTPAGAPPADRSADATV